MLQEIVKNYLTPVYSFVYRIVEDREEAEDITQDIFIKIWKKLDTIDPDKNMKAWIFTIARNTTFDFLRKRKHVAFSEIEDFDVADTAPLAHELFELKEIEEILKSIKHEHKEIILLHDVEELTFEEIAGIVGRPMNTVKSQYRRALHDLHQKYPEIRI